jgi:dihydropyrimidine dehydrogenase (NAD+) subunit PreT
VDIKLDSPVDADGLKALLAGYDAVFLGVGLGSTYELGIPGEDGLGVMEALDFIFQMHFGVLTDCEVGTEVVVIGGGNTAVDVATGAVRLGADHVTMLYRRTADIMSAFSYEYDLAKSDGIGFEWLVQPLEFLFAGDKLTGVRCRRLKLNGDDREAELEPIPDSEFDVPCDMAIKALGQSPLSRLLSGIEGLAFEEGRVVIDPETGATTLTGLFAGGDCISMGAELVNAVQEGKIAARGIDEALKEKHGQA